MITKAKPRRRRRRRKPHTVVRVDTTPGVREIVSHHTVGEYAYIWEVSRASVYKWIASGLIPIFKFGREIAIPKGTPPPKAFLLKFRRDKEKVKRQKKRLAA